MNRQEQEVTINLLSFYLAKMIPHITRSFPYKHQKISKVRFCNIMFAIHNNEVNMKTQAHQVTGVYTEILSTHTIAVRTTASVHIATCRYINSKRLCKQTKLRGCVCADEIHVLSKHDLTRYLYV